MAAQPLEDPGVQHQQPPIFYCWKYWLSTGEVAQGCTAVDVMGEGTMPDPNMYGWMYIVIPLAALLLLLAMLYCCCGTKSTPPPKHKVLLEDVQIEVQKTDIIETNIAAAQGLLIYL